jgi:hypothetical protein
MLSPAHQPFGLQDMRPLLLIVPLVALSGCASIIEGSTQEITVNTTPAGAKCAMMRNGQHIAEVASSPGSAVIKKTGADVTISCTKPGYQEASVVDNSDVAAATFGNIIAGGLVGVVIDAADGSIHKYDPAVSVTLEPLVPPAAATAPAQPDDPGT